MSIVFILENIFTNHIRYIFDFMLFKNSFGILLVPNASFDYFFHSLIKIYMFITS